MLKNYFKKLNPAMIAVIWSLAWPTMLEQAMKVLPEKHNLILHSDQGWHYQHMQYQLALKRNGIIQSMSRKGNCLDNAMMGVNVKIRPMDGIIIKTI